MTHEEYVDVVLDAKPSALLPEDERDLGTDIESGSIRLRLGTRPLVTSLQASQANLGSHGFLLDNFDLWRIDFFVSAIANANRQIKTIDVKVRFEDRAFITLLDVLPRTELITKGSVGGDLQLNASAKLSLQASSAAQIARPAEDFSMVHDAEAADGSVSVSATGWLHWGFKYSVTTPRINASCEGDQEAFWRLHRAGESLIGRHQLTALAIVASDTKQLRVTAQVQGAFPGIFGISQSTLKSDVLPLDLVPQFTEARP